MPGPAFDSGSELDFNQLIKLIYDATENGLKIENVGSPSGQSGTSLDAAEIAKLCFDPTSGKLRIVLI